MKQITAVVLAGTLFAIPSAAQAGLTFTNVSLGPTSISFDVTGTIDGPPPPTGDNWLFFIDPTRANGWIPEFNAATIDSNISANGSNPVDDFWVEPDFGDPSHDRLTLNQEGDGWNAGDTLSGSFAATWFDAIDLTGFGGVLQVYWGRGNDHDETLGTFQGTFRVPAPGTLAMLGIAGVGAARRRR